MTTEKIKRRENTTIWVPKIESLCFHIVFNKGDIADALYIIEFGSVEVEIENSVILGSGEYFGETGLVSEEKRNATISVVEEAKLLKLSKDSLNELIEEYPSLFEDLKTSASNRTGWLYSSISWLDST